MAGELTSAGGENTLLYWDTAQPIREIYYSYNIMFNKNFDGASGGKLPGLVGWGTKYYSGTPLSAGEGCRAMINFKGDRLDGYHAVWNHSDIFYYDSIYSGGYYVGHDSSIYAPYQDGFNPTISNLTYNGDGDVVLTHDSNYKWRNFTFRAVMNTTGNADGSLEFYINGKLVYRQRGVEWMSMGWPGSGWQGISLSFFFGGTVAAPSDSWIIIDDQYTFTYSDDFIDENINRDFGYNDDETVLVLPNWPKE